MEAFLTPAIMLVPVFGDCPMNKAEQLLKR